MWGTGLNTNAFKAFTGNRIFGPVIHWVGDIPMARLAEEYNRCDVFCLPSAQEGFGIVFLEAMAAGKPIVAARVAAVPEVVRNGILVEPDNQEALADRRRWRKRLAGCIVIAIFAILLVPRAFAMSSDTR